MGQLSGLEDGSLELHPEDEVQKHLVWLGVGAGGLAVEGGGSGDETQRSSQEPHTLRVILRERELKSTLKF